MSRARTASKSRHQPSEQACLGGGGHAGTPARQQPDGPSNELVDSSGCRQLAPLSAGTIAPLSTLHLIARSPRRPHLVAANAANAAKSEAGAS